VIRLTVINDISLHAACLALVVAALLGVAGCGNERSMVPVSGKVTYGGGEWPQAGTIGFTPTSAGDGSISRAGSANFGKDGSFVVGSYKPRDGLLPGVYRVKVSSVDPSNFTKSVAELDIVPKDFQVDDLVVEAGSDPIELNLDVPKKE
jgi:hypothetical protein